MNCFLWTRRDYSEEHIEKMRDYVFRRPTPERDEQAKELMKQLRKERAQRKRNENNPPEN